jgi:hypothetical protein
MAKRTAAVSVACATIALSVTAAGPALDACNVVWESPSTNHHGSMPLGNGDVSLNAWMTPDGDLHLYLGKSDAWDDNARLLKLGKVRFRLHPSPIASSPRFRQELNLAKGRIDFTIGPASEPSAKLALWVDAHHPVVHLTVESATPLEASARLELWRTHRHELAELQVSDVLLDRSQPDQKHAPTLIEPDHVMEDWPSGMGWYHHNIKSVGPAVLAEVQGLTGFPMEDPLMNRVFGGVVMASRGEKVDATTLRSPRGTSHRFSIFVLTRHPSTPAGWRSDMDEAIRQIEQRPFSARQQEHETWWEEFWNRSWIRATTRRGTTGADDAAHLSRMYQLQRFITACAGRGAYPIKFNGSLFTVPPGDTEDDPDYRRWGPGYWWQNTRLPYISLCTSGDFDLQQPLFRMYVDQLLPLCTYRTRLYLGHEGAFYPECLYFWGANFSESYGWTPFDQRADKLQESGWHKWEWVGGLELSWMMLDFYDHTLDVGFLRRTALPFSREILTFFNVHYPTNSSGLLVMHPSQSLETWWNCTNAIPELAGCLAITERLMAMSDELVPAADRELCRELRKKLPPLPLRDVNGRKALAPAEFFADKRNIENPELYPVYPFRLFAFNRPNKDWALAALEHRWDKGNRGWRQDDIFMAFLGLTNQARDYLVDRARHADPRERFPAFWGPNYDWTPDQDHGGVLMKAFQAMLLQTEGRSIFLFPAWPAEWDVEFQLHAPLRTVITGVYRNGRIQSLEINPESRRADLEWAR